MHFRNILTSSAEEGGIARYCFVMLGLALAATTCPDPLQAFKRSTHSRQSPSNNHCVLFVMFLNQPLRVIQGIAVNRLALIFVELTA